jgi:nucleotide-binding universal stress UspA family protein
MLTPVQSVLFCTDLSENCRPALEAASSLAARHGATLVLFHVIDQEVPEDVEGYFKTIIGEEKFNKIRKEHEDHAHQALIGKMSSKKIGQSVLRKYGKESGIDAINSEVPWKEIVAENVNVAAAIVNQAEKEGSGLIVMGARKGFMNSNHMGAKVKNVLEKTRIPVLVVSARSK